MDKLIKLAKEEIKKAFDMASDVNLYTMKHDFLKLIKDELSEDALMKVEKAISKKVDEYHSQIRMSNSLLKTWVDALIEEI